MDISIEFANYKKGETVNTSKGTGKIKEIIETINAKGESVPAYLGLEIQGYGELQYIEVKNNYE